MDTLIIFYDNSILMKMSKVLEDSIKCESKAIRNVYSVDKPKDKYLKFYSDNLQIEDVEKSLLEGKTNVIVILPIWFYKSYFKMENSSLVNNLKGKNIILLTLGEENKLDEEKIFLYSNLVGKKYFKKDDLSNEEWCKSLIEWIVKLV